MGALVEGFIGEWKRLVTVRRYRVLTLLLVGVTVLTAAIYESQVVRERPVVVLDFDNSRLSRTLIRFLDSTREVQLVDRAVGSPEEAARLLGSGAIDGFVLIPGDFARSVKRGHPAEIVVAADMSNILTGRNVHKAVARSVATVAAGAEVTAAKKLGERKEEALARVLPVTVDEHLAFNPETSYAPYIVPGVLFFLLNVYVLVLAVSLYVPGHGPATSRGRVGAAVAVAIVGFGAGAALFYVALPYAGLAPQSPPDLVLGALGAFVVTDVLLALAVGAIVPSAMAAVELTVVSAMLSLMLSGITWPTDHFPPALAAFARAIPFTPFAQGLRLLVHETTDLAALLPHARLLAIQASGYAAVALLGMFLRLVVALVRTPREGGAAS